MSSGSSTDHGRPGRQTGFQLWHVYLILSMAGAIWVVIVSRHTHPAALLLLSAAVMAAGFVGMALNFAFSGFFGGSTVRDSGPVSARTRDALLQEKALVLRSLKELEFDRAMGKISDDDFAEIGGRLRERAMVLMEDLDKTPDTGESVEPGARVAVARNPPAARARQEPAVCPSCGTSFDPGARFCKECGAKL
jgi:hypothetical protein